MQRLPDLALGLTCGSLRVAANCMVFVPGCRTSCVLRCRVPVELRVAPLGPRV